MSWHFSQAMEAAYSEAQSSGGAPSAPSRLTPTRGVSSWPDRTTDACQPSLFGPTCEHLTVGRGVEWWISSLAASRARTSASPGKEPALKGLKADCGAKWPESFAKWDPATRSWKTPQCSPGEDSTEFSRTWPRWGIMRDGECWERPTPSGVLALRRSITCASASGSSRRAPTPCAMEPSKDLQAHDAKRARPRSERGGGNGDNLATWIQRAPTPLASEARQGLKLGHWKAGKGLNLATWVREPTPTAQDGRNQTLPASQAGRDSLPGLLASQRGGTPRAADGMARGLRQIPLFANPRGRLEDQIAQAEGPGGTLNPTWVEWLMGWPLGWTDCAGSATARFQQWCHSFGACWDRTTTTDD